MSAIKEWTESEDQIKCYLAYKNIDGIRTITGFVHFIKKIINGNNIVYISQAGVLNQSSGVGRRLMECVLSHFVPETHFYIVTRVFNNDARLLYSNRLNFTPIDESIINELGYDQRYCGFERTTTEEDVCAILDRKIDFIEEKNMTQHLLQMV